MTTVEALRQMADDVTAAAKEHQGPLRDELWRWSERLEWLCARETAVQETGLFTEDRVTAALWSALLGRGVLANERAAILTRFLVHLKEGSP